MPTSPTVSVIIIFLDAERYLNEAIRSVFDQTVSDWELLLVDDGSSDASSTIARCHAAAMPERIRYLEHSGHENRGMSASRNLGIRTARGRYVAFLDADDVWLPDRLATHLALLEAHPEADMAYGPTLVWYGWTGDPADRERDFVSEIGVTPHRVIEPPALLQVFLESRGRYLPGICSLLVRRDALVRLGGFEAAFRGTYEDQVFLSKACLHLPVYVTDIPLDRYRQHPESCCHRAVSAGDYHPDRPHPARKRYLTWLEDYFREQEVDDPALLHALKVELWPYRHPVRYRIRAARDSLTLESLRGSVLQPVKRRLRRSMGDRTWRLLKTAAGRQT